MTSFWARLFGENRARSGRQRLAWQQQPALIYAVGDVHGCLDELKAIEAAIVADAAASDGDKFIVMLGDYIDRGPKSAQTIDWLTGRAPLGLRRICLAGNHETLMLAALAEPDRCDNWLNWGGLETLESYGVDVARFVNEPARRHALLQASIPAEHRLFLESLPILLQTPKAIFTHAGTRPGISLADQVEEDLLWIREPFLSLPQQGTLPVIHGHTPADAPEIRPWRIGIDTAAYSTGVLTAARLDAAGNVTFLQTQGHEPGGE